MKQFPVLKCAVLAMVTVLVACSGTKPESNRLPTNSFADYFKESTVKYAYHDPSQIHDYSGNWDLDGDAVPDSVKFIGNGGAHLQYHLFLHLSKAKTGKAFPWLYTDFPLLESYASLKVRDSSNNTLPKFVVHDFNGDGLKDIYLNAGDAGYPLPPQFSETGLNSPEVIVAYDQEEGGIRFGNY